VLWLGKSRGGCAFLDGKDGDRRFKPARKYGPYFKREFGRRTSTRVNPISFSIPEAKVRTRRPEKIQQFGRHVQCEEAYRLPQVREHCARGYLFDQEIDYYNDLAQSCFAITMKKGGWDCMRHYEIAANHCVPAFYQLENKPPRCAPHGLKDMDNVVAFNTAAELKDKLTDIDRDNAYDDLRNNAVVWAKEHTCEAMALRMIQRLKRLGVASHLTRH